MKRLARKFSNSFVMYLNGLKLDLLTIHVGLLGSICDLTVSMKGSDNDAWEIPSLSDNRRVLVDGFVSTALSMGPESTFKGLPEISLCSKLVSPSLNFLIWYIFSWFSSFKFSFPIMNQKQSNFKICHDFIDV